MGSVMSIVALLLLLAAPQRAPGQTAPATAPPVAQSPATMIASPMAMAIAGFDADGDGRTSRAELTAGIARSFAAIDTAHRGKLRYLDYADWALRWLGDRNALPSPLELDTDGDDAVSLAEVQARFAAEFDRLDTDHDGYVSRAELLTIRDVRSTDGERHGKRPSR